MSLSLHPQFVLEHGPKDDCEGCLKSFPRLCRCGGRIHAERGDESAAGDVWLNRWCSDCGIDWDEPIRAR